MSKEGKEQQSVGVKEGWLQKQQNRRKSFLKKGTKESEREKIKTLVG